MEIGYVHAVFNEIGAHLVGGNVRADLSSKIGHVLATPLWLSFIFSGTTGSRRGRT